MQIPVPTFSKKLVASLAAVIVGYLAMRDGMSNEQVAMILSPLLIYIPSQGIADIGKGREQARMKAAANGNGKLQDPNSISS